MTCLPARMTGLILGAAPLVLACLFGCQQATQEAPLADGSAIRETTGKNEASGRPSATRAEPEGESNRALEDRLRGHVAFLASDSTCGREAGTEGEEVARRYISDRLAEIGLETLPGCDSYAQAFKFDTADGETRTAHNVVGVLDRGAARTIVLGAHYDHLGMGGRLSRSPGQHAIHPGADDNASGVAVLIELARVVARSGLRNNNYLFIAFSAHEEGLHGSRHFVESGACDMSTVNFMMNFDCVGRLDPEVRTLFVGGVSTSPAFESLLGSVASPDLRVREKVLPQGDHSPFLAREVPVLFFTTGMHDDYHKVSDMASKLDYQGMAQIVVAIRETLLILDGKGKIAHRDP